MITIGLTGSIASGKSEVGKILARKGLPIIDADKVAHATYLPGAEGYQPVIDAFGDGIKNPDGSIYRHELGKLAFKDEASLKKLTRIVWPLTRARIVQLQKELEDKGAKVAVLEAAVLGEAGWEDLTDEIWKTTVSPENALKRLMWRGTFTLNEAKSRIAMLGLYTMGKDADLIIENDGSLAELDEKVHKAFDEFKRRRGVEV
jgi:dephospho-CoA kinase